MAKIHSQFGKKAREAVGTRTQVGTKQLFGIEKSAFGVELAKVTVMLAKELALEDSKQWIDARDQTLPIDFEPPLPLDNLDDNFKCDDALFCEWPNVNAIVGNPPFQSKNKAQQELGAAYMGRVRARYPEVPGRADYCVYWFRRAHDELAEGSRAGLVGTNTIRQNYSRIGGLDHIVKSGGTITEAVSSQVWQGEAVVHVSIVNWLKGAAGGKKLLYTQLGDKKDSPWEKVSLSRINSALSTGVDVTQAIALNANSSSELCMQGQTQGHDGFLVTPAQARAFIAKQAEAAEILRPYLIGDDLLDYPAKPSRFIIDFHPRDVIEASRFKDLITHIQTAGVVTAREAAA
jgi:hypothetical protein